MRKSNEEKKSVQTANTITKNQVKEDKKLVVVNSQQQQRLLINGIGPIYFSHSLRSIFFFVLRS